VSMSFVVFTEILCTFDCGRTEGGSMRVREKVVICPPNNLVRIACLPFIPVTVIHCLVKNALSVDINEHPCSPVTPLSPNKTQRRHHRFFKMPIFVAICSFLHLVSSDQCNLGEVLVTGGSSSSESLPSFYHSASRFSD
jgi:hypothetical protein